MIEFHCADSLEWMRAQPAGRFDLTFGSPPYCDARTYGIDAQRTCEEWVAWMLDITEAAARITKGPVIWVAAGVTRKRNYWPACEGLMWEWWKRHGTHKLYRPCVFHRVGIPGSGGDDWFRSDWEYVLCFKRPGALPWSNNTAIGHPPKWAPGGAMSHRLTSGQRVNQWGPVGGPGGGGARRANGSRKLNRRPSHRLQRGNEKGSPASVPAIANPGNVFRLNVGGRTMGNALCHENEAPFPEKLAEIFIRSFCPEGGTVLDPFLGSGTTADVAREWGRNCVGVDLRQSQIDLSKKRLAQQLLAA